MNVVIPMAGRGSRFAEHGVEIPKPLIPVCGKPMFAWALESLEDVTYQRVVFVTLAEHADRYDVEAVIRRHVGSAAEVLVIDEVTEGQLCTVLAAREHLDADEGVLIASADTYVRSDLGRDIRNRASDCRGVISVACMPGDRWSFARVDGDGKVVQVAEKKRISPHASTGLYYFSSGREFLAVAEEMIRREEKTRDEYYVIPVYQTYIERGWPVELSHAHEMVDMGTPATLAAFERALSGLE